MVQYEYQSSIELWVAVYGAGQLKVQRATFLLIYMINWPARDNAITLQTIYSQFSNQLFPRITIITIKLKVQH